LSHLARHLFRHRFKSEDRRFRKLRFELPPHSIFEGARVAVHVEDESGKAARGLGTRNINVRPGIRNKVVIAYITHDPNHRGPALCVGSMNLSRMDAVPQRALPGPLASSQDLIDKGHVISAIVCGIEIATFPQGLAYGRKICRADGIGIWIDVPLPITLIRMRIRTEVVSVDRLAERLVI